MLLLLNGKINFDFIGCVERFDEDFSYIRTKFYNDPDPCPNSSKIDGYHGQHHATNAHKKIDVYYNKEAIELVKEIYAVDFQKLGYSTDIKDVYKPPIIRTLGK